MSYEHSSRSLFTRRRSPLRTRVTDGTQNRRAQVSPVLIDRGAEDTNSQVQAEFHEIEIFDVLRKRSVVCSVWGEVGENENFETDKTRAR